MNLVERAKKIVLQPKLEWDVIAAEATPTVDLYRGYVMPLAAIGAVASIIGLSLVGISSPFMGGTYRVPLTDAIGQAAVGYILTLVGVYVIALIIDALAPAFGATKNPAQALKVAVYASTPSWLAGIVMLLPMLGIVGMLAALYGIYLLYLGLPLLMKAPAEKAVAYTAVVVVVAFVVMMAIGAISGLFMPSPNMLVPDFDGRMPR